MNVGQRNFSSSGLAGAMMAVLQKALPKDGLRLRIVALLLARHRRLLLEGRDEPRRSLTNLLPLLVRYN